jgi:hypothetical protein
MKKTVISRPTKNANFPETKLWLDLGALADVEISSEDAMHPFETALSTDGSG